MRLDDGAESQTFGSDSDLFGIHRFNSQIQDHIKGRSLIGEHRSTCFI
jgi:hypothetical protein